MDLITDLQRQYAQAGADLQKKLIRKIPAATRDDLLAFALFEFSEKHRLTKQYERQRRIDAARGEQTP